jgi:hypothetical protein
MFTGVGELPDHEKLLWFWGAAIANDDLAI